MSTATPVTRVREKTTTVLDIPLTNSEGEQLDASGLTTLTATMLSLDTGQPIARWSVAT